MRTRSTAASAALTAVLLAGCGPKSGNETGRVDTGFGAMHDTSMAMPDTSLRPGNTGTDTGIGTYDSLRDRSRADTGKDTTWKRSDTSTHRSDSGWDSARGNQTKSGVTDTRTGKSTLGPGVAKTRPDQGAPVTSKGDTILQGGDSVGSNP